MSSSPSLLLSPSPFGLFNLLLFLPQLFHNRNQSLWAASILDELHESAQSIPVQTDVENIGDVLDYVQGLGAIIDSV